MKKSVFSIAVLSALMLIFAACSNSSGGSGNGTGTETGTEDQSQVAEKTISAESGGEVKAGDNVVITIPAGALDKDTTITVTYYKNEKDISDAPSEFLGGVEFGPDGTVFNEPVEVKMKLAEKTSNKSISVFCYDEEEDIWDFVTDASIEEGYAKFKLNHFSKYELQDRIPNSSEMFKDLVNKALATGKSDEWVMDQWLDHLINEEDVMNHLKRFDEYWYEPCGVSVHGDYHVNGVENSASMYKQHGVSNKVGNKYGWSYFNGSSLSRTEFLKKKNKVTENQELYSSFSEVDYRMIEPQIELSAEKTTLKKGESVTVEVYCHYGDLPFDDYELTLPYELKKFKTDVDKVVTDADGKAKFTATAIEKGSEKIKVMFYRTGYLTGRPEGIAYSAAEILLTCGGIDINGHIVEEREYSFGTCLREDLISETPGHLKITVEYDYEGLLNVVDSEIGKVEGSITYSNPEIDIESSAVESYNDGGDGVVIHTTIKWYDNWKTEYTAKNVVCDVSGTIKENHCELAYECDLKPLVGATGEMPQVSSGGGHTATNDGANLCYIFLGGDKKPLLGFDLENGDSEVSDNTFKDVFRDEFYPSEPDYLFTIDGGFPLRSRTFKTTQTITVDLPE